MYSFKNRLLFNTYNKYMKIIYAMGDREVSYLCLKMLTNKNIYPQLFLFPKNDKGFYIEKVKNEYPNTKFIEGTKFRNKENLNLIKNIDADYILSILFPYIYRNPIFDYIKIGILNLHPSYLPYNRGWHACSWCILEGTKIGATLHWVDEGIDTGKICIQKELIVEPHYTANDIYQKIKDIEIDIFKDALPKIMNNTLNSKQQSNDFTEHFKKDLIKVQKINLSENVNCEKFIDKLRALTTNNIKEGAYFIKDSKKYYINIKITPETGY